MTEIELNDLLIRICAVILEVDARELDPDEELAAWGIDSVAAAMIHDLIETRVIRDGCDFSFNDFLGYATINQLSGALIRNDLVGELRPMADIIRVPDLKNPGPESCCRKKALAPELTETDTQVNSFRFKELGFSAPGHRTMYNGQPMISFASNDYLSFSTDEGARAAAARAIREYGTGCGSSMLGSGSLTIHAALAEELADFLGKESVLLMPAGYMAMLGFCSSRIFSGHSIFSDALNHRSIIDGLRLGKGASERKDAFHFFNHNSLKSLRQIREFICGPEISEMPDIVVMEGVYSMDGDRGALDEFVPYCKAQGMQIAIDDAHGIGVLGNQGRGTADEFAETADLDYILGTFSKSFAASGGFIAGSEDAIDDLRQECSQYMFSASLTPPVVETVRYILGRLRQDSRPIARLWDNINYLKSCLADLGVSVMNSNSAIFPVLIGKEEKALDVARRLSERKGIFVLPVIYPVVPRGKARLRISVNAGHSHADIDCLAASLAEMAATDHR